MVLGGNDELNSHSSSHVPEISNITSRPHDQPSRIRLQQLSSIEILEVSGISPLKELPPWLHQLTIKRCDALQSLPEGMIMNTCLQYLAISDCPNLKSFPKDGLPSTLKFLHIFNCRELELLSPEETMLNYYASLKSLDLCWSCDSLKSFPLGSFPKLNHLVIWNCNNLKSLQIPEVLHADISSLRVLQILECPKFASFPKEGLPTPNLTYFKVEDCKNLKSLPARMHALLPSLQCLRLYKCFELESFPEGGLPPNLISLGICNFNKLTVRRMECGLQRLAFLKDLYIDGSEEVESLPEEGLLPPSLTSLHIWKFPNLKYLDKRGLQHLTHLKQLNISKCPKLQCLPEEGLPASLSLLEIMDCPLLKQWCHREKGEDWLKIARISSIVIDDELIS